MNRSRIIIAGVRGGSGKTTVSLAVIRALRGERKLTVIPFKKGPDYIDAGWLAAAAGHPCYSLDPFLMPREKVLSSFLNHHRGEVAVIEGNRGLHDGLDAEGAFSTAALAKLLRAPVILVVDCTKMTRTTAAVVLGCIALDRDVAIEGVILNQVASRRHEAIAREAVTRYCGIPVIGAIPRLRDTEFPERHMGLTPFHEHPDTSGALEIAGMLGAKHIDLDSIVDIAAGAPPFLQELPVYTADGLRPWASREASLVRIGVIKDAAFQFYYPENLEELQKCGAELVEVDALRDDSLPNVDALYIGGGFPETNAVMLARNGSFRQQVRDAAEGGMPIYAECGGLMFLGHSISVDGRTYPMADVLPLRFEMKKRPQAHGYTIVEVDRANPFYPVGTVLHGHEFHYSTVVDSEPGIMSMAFRMRRGKGLAGCRDGIVYKNVLATYTHVHALGADCWAEGLIRKAKEYREERR